MSLLHRQTILIVRLNSRLNLRVREDLSLGNDNPLLTRVIRHSSADLRTHRNIFPAIHGKVVGIGDLGEAGAVATCIGGARPGVFAAAVAVFANEARDEA